MRCIVLSCVILNAEKFLTLIWFCLLHVPLFMLHPFVKSTLMYDVCGGLYHVVLSCIVTNILQFYTIINKCGRDIALLLMQWSCVSFTLTLWQQKLNPNWYLHLFCFISWPVNFLNWWCNVFIMVLRAENIFTSIWKKLLLKCMSNGFWSLFRL